MHLVENKSKHGKKIYNSVLLRESYRENGKVKKRTIANISHCKREEIEAIKLALKCKGNLSYLLDIRKDISIEQGLSVGAVWTLYKIAERLGISRALGYNREGRLALWQVISRVINQGSRLSAIRLANEHASIEVLGIDKSFDENDLYKNLQWLSDNQENIEKKLFKTRKRNGKGKVKLFLYDVTSSYLEGNNNEYGEYGYNRDKKRGKKQIVVGLLCDSDGIPVSVEVFKGNTNDVKTFSNQVKKVSERFGCEDVVFVGDRGMIKSNSIENLPEDFHYITAITKKQIETLISNGKIEVGIFDDKLCEINDGGVRYLLRRNPEREAEIQETRKEKISYIKEQIFEKNQYLSEHPRAKVEIAVKNIEKLIEKLRINKYAKVESKGRELFLKIDEEALSEEAKLDGCYVLKTDVKASEMSKEEIHARYKDLSLVEWAFRSCKSTLEIRPVFVRKKGSTQGHVFIVMLSYILIKYLQESWEKLNVTVLEGIENLSHICTQKLTVKGKSCFTIPTPTERGKALLESVSVRLPEALPIRRYQVVTKKKLTKE